METVLLTIAFIGVVFLLFTPWLKTSAVVAIASIVGYFYIAGVESWTPIILITLGLVLIVAEVFVPDFGLLGILGVLSVAGGLYITTGDFGLMIRDLSVAIISSIVIILLLIRNGYSLSHLNKLVLNTASNEPKEQEERVEKPRLTVGMVGESLTPLRPSGKAKFDDYPQHVDVLSGEGHIERGAKIAIQEVHGSKVVVRHFD